MIPYTVSPTFSSPLPQRRNQYTVALTILSTYGKHTPSSVSPPGEALQKSNFFYSTNDYTALHSQHTPSSVSSPGEALQKSNFFIVPTITNLSDSILAVLGNSIQSELWTLKNLFFRVHLNLERA